MNEPDHTHHRNEDRPRCTDCVVDAGKQLTELKKETADHSGLLSALKRETSEQSETLKTISTTVGKINDALVGDYEKQGLIGRVDAQIKALANDILDLKTWKKKSEDAMKSLTWRIVGYGIAFIGILISAVVIYVQLNKGKI
jgi:hypothetical protein